MEKAVKIEKLVPDTSVIIEGLVSEKYDFKIEFAGKKPSAAEIKYAKLGEIDALIRDLAYEVDGVLFTADKVQARIAETKNVKHLFIELEQIAKRIKLEDFFDKETMSVHLRENVLPYAKKGIPGSWQFVAIKKKKLEKEEIQDISRE